jgi:beta-glucanase (GH16 family)
MKNANSLILMAMICFTTGCKKDPLLKPKCEKISTTGGFRFNNLVLDEEFDGYNAAQAARDSTDERPECYTQTPYCENHIAWSSGTECPAGDYSHMAGLNKCRWSIYNGYSFWSKINNFTPAQVRTESGHVVFTSKVNPGVTEANLDCKDPTGTEVNPAGTTCKYTSGGMNTKSRGQGTPYPGFSTKSGRVEMRARFPAVAGAYPAGWMWSGDGHPNHGNPTYDWIREIDIFEAPFRGASDYPIFQTFHNWTRGGSIARQYQAKDIRVPTADVTYGVEFDGNLLRFYANDCWVGDVKNGDTPQASWEAQPNPNYIGEKLSLATTDPQSMFLILSLGVDSTQSLPPNPATYPANGAEMWVDYVKVYR